MTKVLSCVRSYPFLVAAGIAASAVFLMFQYAAASSSSVLLPVSDGAYKQWTPSTGTTHYTLVDDAACNGTTDYNSTTVVGNRDSYAVSTSSIPNGAVITQIDIQPCASRTATGGTNPIMNVFYRFNGVNSADAGAYSLTGATPTNLATTSFTGLALVKTATSTIEVGAVLTSGAKGARLSRIAVVLTYVTVPNAPSGATVNASTTDPYALVSWTDNSSDETAFEVVRSTDNITFTHIASTSANTTHLTDTGIAASTNYYYKVRAYNANGYSGYSNTATTTSYAAPAAPSGLSGSAFGTSTPSINLTWIDNSFNEKTFSLERSTSTPITGFYVIKTLNANASSTTDTAVISGATYYYRISAVNGYGASAYSNVASTTLP
jgi:hypothetical protein